MIIKNNFNSKSSNPLNNYNSIGKGSHSLDKELEREREGFIKENIENPVLQDLRGENDDREEEITNDKWDFFR